MISRGEVVQAVALFRFTIQLGQKYLLCEVFCCNKIKYLKFIGKTYFLKCLILELE
jgi:hypothetical protein